MSQPRSQTLSFALDSETEEVRDWVQYCRCQSLLCFFNMRFIIMFVTSICQYSNKATIANITFHVYKLLHTVLHLRLCGRFAALTKKIKSLISQGRYDDAAKLVGDAGFDGLRKELLIELTVKMTTMPKPKPALKPKGLKELFDLDSMIRFEGLSDYNFN